MNELIMTDANVLITGAGSILAQGIIKSLRHSNDTHSSPITYRIFSSDISPYGTGLYRSDKGFLVPSPTSSEYAEQITRICKNNSIQAIFVGTDEEIIPLLALKDRIEKDTGATLISNPESVLNASLDKWKTYEFLRKNRIACPSSALEDRLEQFIAEFGFPIVVKPRQGHGSLHFYIVQNRDDLKYAISNIKKIGWDPILQEYLQGSENEFTAGVTVDKSGRCMSSISMRKMIKNGQTYKAHIDTFPSVTEQAEIIAKKIGARGPINIQSKTIDGKPKVFEINPRFSATCPLRAAAGINEPDIIFRNYLLDERIECKEYQKLVCLRYWNEVYVPVKTYERITNEKSIVESDAFVLNYF